VLVHAKKRVPQRVCLRGDAFAALALRRAPSAEAGRWRHKAAATSAPTKSGRIGRQAPVKRCLARFAGLVPCVSNGKARCTVSLRRKMDGVL